MNSPTHSLLALALLSKAGDSRRNWAVFIGSIVPDIIIYIWAPYQSWIKGESGQHIWNELYFQAPMQNLIAYFNSIPIYAVLAIAGYLARRHIWGKFMLFFALAALIHMATDIPVHGHDAYRHFWPLSDWRFHSPFSYYEADLHARWVNLVEALLGLIAIALLWLRFPKLWVRIMLSALAAIYILVQIFLWLAANAAPS